MGVNYQKINEALKNLHSLRKNKCVHRQVVKEVNGDYGDEGESNEIYEVYDIGLEGGIFVKIRLGSNSYGYNETIDGIEFVQAVEKTVTVYEYK